MEQAPAGIVFDILDDADLDRAGAAIWDASAGRTVFTLSAQGLASGLARHLSRLGLGDRTRATSAPLRPVDRLLVLSGSCSPQTAAQINRARADGWAAGGAGRAGHPGPNAHGPCILGRAHSGA
jgi:uncharacterized protein YgbK (DUF1537 family)